VNNNVNRAFQKSEFFLTIYEPYYRNTAVINMTISQLSFHANNTMHDVRLNTAAYTIYTLYNSDYTIQNFELYNFIKP